ncbi:hypothetical protein U1Q18_052658 [Sarracenia purpurea var. burkii]
MELVEVEAMLREEIMVLDTEVGVVKEVVLDMVRVANKEVDMVVVVVGEAVAEVVLRIVLAEHMEVVPVEEVEAVVAMVLVVALVAVVEGEVAVVVAVEKVMVQEEQEQEVLDMVVVEEPEGVLAVGWEERMRVDMVVVAAVARVVVVVLLQLISLENTITYSLLNMPSYQF